MLTTTWEKEYLKLARQPKLFIAQTFESKSSYLNLFVCRHYSFFLEQRSRDHSIFFSGWNWRFHNCSRFILKIWGRCSYWWILGEQRRRFRHKVNRQLGHTAFLWLGIQFWRDTTEKRWWQTSLDPFRSQFLVQSHFICGTMTQIKHSMSPTVVSDKFTLSWFQCNFIFIWVPSWPSFTVQRSRYTSFLIKKAEQGIPILITDTPLNLYFRIGFKFRLLNLPFRTVFRTWGFHMSERHKTT